MKNDWNTISILRSKKNGLRLKALLENRPSAGNALLDILENAKIQDLTENDVIRIACEKGISRDRIVSVLEITREELTQRLSELESHGLASVKAMEASIPE
ncbi:MAG TPA: hypothetical protein VNI77_08260 [Nitrososphaera sp.]|nr:hypothetical protein [Nitrososphaera sp.]